MKLSTAIKLVQDELELAKENHDDMHSPHEGYAVLKEEVEELWDEVKAGQGTTHRGVSEAVQVAAMALRYLVDLCEDTTAVEHERKVSNHERKVTQPWSDSYGSYGGRGGYSG